jgi:hypothetical protein
MADFCRQCSIDIFGKDFGDMTNISTPEDTARDFYAKVLCEDCGLVQVDHEGNCITHGSKPEHGYTARPEPNTETKT